MRENFHEQRKPSAASENTQSGSQPEKGPSVFRVWENVRVEMPVEKTRHVAQGPGQVSLQHLREAFIQRLVQETLESAQRRETFPMRLLRGIFHHKQLLDGP